MIKSLRLKNFGCIKEANVALTALHAFIGPNDSGKSTFLRAVRTITKYASGHGEAREVADDFLSSPSRGGPSIEITASVLEGTYKVALQAASDAGIVGADHVVQEELHVPGRTVPATRMPSSPSIVLNQGSDDPNVVPLGARFRRELRPAHLLRLDPDVMGAPSALVPEADMVQFIDARGAGLAGVYDALERRRDGSMLKIEERLRLLFPSVKRLRLPPFSGSQIAMVVDLNDGTSVPIRRASEGMLYFLAYAVLPYVGDPGILLVEEPENGLHPARIAEVVQILRSLTATSGDRSTQVLIATHSPLVVNELQPHEVTVVTRPGGAGSLFTPMAETTNFAERSKVYALGELWLSYANGTDEGPLLNRPPKASKGECE